MAVVILLAESWSSLGQQHDPSLPFSATAAETNVELEFDESDIRNLNLKLKWRFMEAKTGEKTRLPTRFILLMQQKRLNVSSFVFDVPQLIDDGKAT